MKKRVENEIQMNSLHWMSDFFTWVGFHFNLCSKKNGDVYLCVDMRNTDNAIIRNCCSISILDEILYKVNGACFSARLSSNSS